MTDAGRVPGLVARLGDERLTAILRLVAVPVLLVGVVYVPKPEPSDTRFLAVLAAFAVYALAAFAVTGRRDERWYRGFVGVDVIFAGALSYSSGGGYSQLRLAFLFPIVTAAFRCRPRLTIAVTAAAIAVYGIQALPHPSARSEPDSTSFILAQMVYIAWIGLALTALSFLLARRELVVRTLVAELFRTEERERRRLAEDLHDNAIQNLLAARRELERAASRDLGGHERRALDTIEETLVQLRAEVASLHPHLLDHVGLGAAIAHAAEAAAARGGFAVELDIEDTGRRATDGVLLRAAGELLANAERHARAATVRIRVSRDDGWETLEVADDGVGFDPHAVASAVRPGHIGLISLRQRCEGLGGSVDIEARAGEGSVVTVRLPQAP